VFSGFSAYVIDGGASWTLPGAVTLTASKSLSVGGTLTLTGNLTDQGSLDNTGVIAFTGTGLETLAAPGVVLTNAGTLKSSGAATLVLAAGATIANAGGAIAAIGAHLLLDDDQIDGGMVEAPGTTGVAFFNTAGGELDGAAAPVNLFGTFEVKAGSNETLVGAVGGVATLVLLAGAANADLIIGAGGASITNMTIDLSASSAGSRIYGAAAGDTLTNVSGAIVGAGQLGNGQLTLVNDTQGFIGGNQNTALTINTGTIAIINAGHISNFGAGTVVMSSLVNTGTLEVTDGTLTLAGAVTGAGVGEIAGGTLYAQSSFSENVNFFNSDPPTLLSVLELAQSTSFAGIVSGLSRSINNSLDLLDIAFASSTTKATYSGTTTSGVLTVTDGTHTAHVHLLGNYVGAPFKVSSDGHGGTRVIDSAAPSAAHLTAAISAWPSSAGTAGDTRSAWSARQLPDLLVARA
jgi:hypothetical protein